MNTKHKIYLVGGAVRDELLGIPSKDMDYVMLAPSFQAMRDDLLAQGCKVFVEKPEFLTIRCKHPVLGCIDVSCARRDGVYQDGRRPDAVAVADTLEQDLERRDFTCNAIAKSLEHGRLLDPHKGQKDIEDRLLRCVGSSRARFGEDKLRAFRALRFTVTKGFRLSHEIQEAIDSLTPMQFDGVSTERIREELFKMFKHDTERSFKLLFEFRVLCEVVRKRGIWMKPTTES